MKPEIQLNRTLSLAQVVFLGLAWMTPMIYFTTYGVAFETSRGMLTQAYALAFCAIFFTALSYGAMARRFPTSGSSYTYAGKAIHPKAGFLVGWSVLMDYLFSPLIAYLMFGIFMHAQFPSVPAAVWIVLINLVLTAVSALGIKFSAALSKTFVLLQIVFIGFFCAILAKRLIDGGIPGNPLEPFLQTEVPLSVLLAGASIICFSFLGFDSVTTMSEETVNAGKTVPKAILLIILIASVIYLTTSYITQLAFPGLQLPATDDAAFELMKLVGGAGLSALFITVLVFAIFTQGLASLTTVTRLLYVMGRDSELPKRTFGYLHPKFKTPLFNIAVVNGFALLALVIPLDMALTFINFGALTAFFFVNLSVIAQLYIRDRKRSAADTIRYLLFPLVGAFIVGWLLSLLDGHALMTGLAWIIAGAAYKIWRSKGFKRPFLAAKPAIAEELRSDKRL
ncbi:APC family permease [Paenibacillus thailandensis]|uniref:APC family permease n=1 Tax=Paenibacillus thailandensis TaxID=393250 RepID=A0ABW5QVA2_9BACL